MPRFRKEAAGNADYFPFRDGLDCRGYVVHALVQSCVEALEGLVSIVGLPDPLVLLGRVCSQDPHVVSIKVTQELEHGCSGVKALLRCKR